MKPPIDFAILNTIFNGLGDKTFNLDVLRLYDRALAATSCGVVISDMSQSEEPIIYCNPAFEKITGYPREETIGRNCRFLQGEETDPIAVDTIRQAISAGKECQVILINYRKDGTPFWNELTLSPVRDDTGQVTHYIGIQYDISDRKQKEQMQRLMQFSIDRAADAAFYIAPNGTFLYVNEAACCFLGYSRQEFLMLNASDINPLMSGKYWERHWRELKRSQSLTFETTQQTKEGRIIPVEINANYLEFNEQEYSCVFARDISDRYQSQAALKRSEELYRTLAQNIPNSVVL
ncbi:MAG: PAS domain-containing protein, partial [Chroococcales cyanobacterium]